MNSKLRIPLCWKDVAILGLAMLVARPVPAAGQAIQLPSFHSFSVDTTVVVPDSGPRPVGTVRSGRAGSTRFSGLPGRSAGVERDVAGAAALAQIHDPREADLALTREAQARRSSTLPQGATGPKRSQARPAFDPEPLKSVAQIQRERASGNADFDRETQQVLERARTAAAGGKPKVAAVYYSSAARRATGSLKQQIEREWRQLDAVTGGLEAARKVR